MLETRQALGRFAIDFENSDQFDVTYTDNYEFLEYPFPIAPDVTIPVDGYRFEDIEVGYSLGQPRRLSGRLSVQHGSFYGGTRTSVNLGFGNAFGGPRFEVTPRLSIEPIVSINRIELPQGRFTTHLVTARTVYSLTPLAFVSALVQYNSSTDAVSTNLRLRWEYSPGSELFVVYNEERLTLGPQRLPWTENRGLIVKLNRLLRF